MNVPKISVLMTAYNRAKYIGEAIESVIRSTFQDWELIIVDDISSDATLEIAKNYASRDARIKVFLNEKNLGDYPNRNKAASLASGKYLKYVDADDQLYEHGLELMWENMERFPDADWGLMSLSQDTDRPFPFQLSPAEVYKRHYFHKAVFLKAPLSAIIKKTVFEKANGFLPVRHYGDYELWHRLALHHPVVLMQDGLVWWRGHAEQEASKRKSKPWVAIETANAALANIKNADCPLSEDDKKTVIKKLNNFKAGAIIRQLKALKPAMALRLFRLSKSGKY